MTRRRAPGAVAGLAVVAALLTGCTDDQPDADPDKPSAALSAALRDATSGAAPEDAVPQVVSAVAAASSPLPDELSVAVLDVLAEHPDALRAAAGPSAPGMAGPSVALDDSALDALVAAGGDDEAAEEFRIRYVAYVEGGVERTIRDAPDGDWYDALEMVGEVWIDPSAEVIGALEAGCDQSGGTCDDRLDQAERELRDAVETAAYAVIPARLLPKVFVRDGERVPMSDWTQVQKDDWQRLRDTTVLPQTAGSVERAALARRQSSGA
jgi:hypothetical protein